MAGHQGLRRRPVELRLVGKRVRDFLRRRNRHARIAVRVEDGSNLSQIRAALIWTALGQKNASTPELPFQPRTREENVD